MSVAPYVTVVLPPENHGNVANHGGKVLAAKGGNVAVYQENLTDGCAWVY